MAINYYDYYCPTYLVFHEKVHFLYLHNDTNDRNLWFNVHNGSSRLLGQKVTVH